MSDREDYAASAALSVRSTLSSFMERLIAILVILLVGLMARKAKGSYRRRMRGRYIKGNVNELLAIGALASEDVVLAAFDETVNERSYIGSIRATYAMRDYTVEAGVGPIMVGVSHGDYTAAEIEEWIENSGSWNEGDLVQSKEVGKRLIRKVGTFDTRAMAATEESVLNDGKPIYTKLGWILNQGVTLNLWAYNHGSAAVSTTVPDINCEGHVNLWAGR